MTKLIIVRKGGPGSGHFNHAGIPGHQGGSLPGKGGAAPSFENEGWGGDGIDYQNKTPKRTLTKQERTFVKRIERATDTGEVEYAHNYAAKNDVNITLPHNETIAESARIDNEYDDFFKMRRPALEEEYRRSMGRLNYGDISKISKDEMVTTILTNKYGDTRLDPWRKYFID